MFRFTLALVLLGFLPGVAVAFVTAGAALIQDPSILWPVVAGTVAGIVVDQFVFRRVPFIETFEHELTHAVAALMFFRRVTGFRVRGGSGAVQHVGGFGGRLGDDFIGLAPYVLPTFTVVSVLVRPFLGLAWFPWFDGWIGFTFGYHLWSSLDETRQAWTRRAFSSAADGEVTQSDIARRGFIYSFIYIATVTIAIHGVLLAILVNGYSGVPPWAREVWDTTQVFVVAVWDHAVVVADWVRKSLGR